MHAHCYSEKALSEWATTQHRSTRNTHTHARTHTAPFVFYVFVFDYRKIVSYERTNAYLLCSRVSSWRCKIQVLPKQANRYICVFECKWEPTGTPDECSESGTLSLVHFVFEWINCARNITKKNESIKCYLRIPNANKTHGIYTPPNKRHRFRMKEWRKTQPPNRILCAAKCNMCGNRNNCKLLFKNTYPYQLIRPVVVRLRAAMTSPTHSLSHVQEQNTVKRPRFPRALPFLRHEHRTIVGPLERGERK